MACLFVLFVFEQQQTNNAEVSVNIAKSLISLACEELKMHILNYMSDIINPIPQRNMTFSLLNVHFNCDLSYY